MKISCDQVCWILDIFDRELPEQTKVTVSREREMKMYGMLYELMEVVGVELEDDAAIHNATPPSLRHIISASKDCE